MSSLTFSSSPAAATAPGGGVTTSAFGFLGGRPLLLLPIALPSPPLGLLGALLFTGDAITAAGSASFSLIFTPMTSPLSYFTPSFFQKSSLGTILRPRLLVRNPPMACVLTTFSSSSSLNLECGDSLRFLPGGRPRGLPEGDGFSLGVPGLGSGSRRSSFGLTAAADPVFLSRRLPRGLRGLKSSLDGVSSSPSPSSPGCCPRSPVSVTAFKASTSSTSAMAAATPPSLALSHTLCAARTSSQFSGTPSTKRDAACG
mmetsp:Transcript_2024/g.6782  ORF Transcript_2024/g.6782 Transcript_2024/m.6782 type:complete len:257 (-) Transcript_2024:933-1703(-)